MWTRSAGEHTTATSTADVHCASEHSPVLAHPLRDRARLLERTSGTYLDPGTNQLSTLTTLVTALVPTLMTALVTTLVTALVPTLAIYPGSYLLLLLKIARSNTPCLSCNAAAADADADADGDDDDDDDITLLTHPLITLY